MRPPRALAVPFELGRPFGAPNEPDFQRRVLLAALKLLERTDGPFIEDFPDEPPGPPADMEGWTCPVNLALPQTDLSDAEKLALDLKQEVALLRPWYEESVAKQNGRRLDGLTEFSTEEIVDHLVAYAEDQDTPSFLEGENMARAIKLTCDDLKHFYYQAALAKPAATYEDIDNWFFGESLGGTLILEIRKILIGLEDPVLKRVGLINLLPHAMSHHAT